MRQRSAIYILTLLLLPFIFFWDGTRLEKMLGDGDAFVQFLPFWTYAARQWASGTPPFWTSYIFSGYPMLAEPQAAVFHPLLALFVYFPPLLAMNLTVLLHHGMAGVLAYLTAREEELTPEASLLAGIAFAFCGFLIGHQAITPVFTTAACFPAIFFALRRLSRRINYSSVFIVSLAVLLLVLSGHPQFTFYALFFGLFYAAYLYRYQVPPARRRFFARAALVSGATGACMAAFQLLPTLELVTRSLRSSLTFDEFLWKSHSVATLLTSLLSTHLGMIFVNDGSESLLDVGALVLTLAAAGAILSRRRAAFWSFLFCFGALLFMGRRTPLFPLMYYVPGYNLFRVASRNGIAVDFAVVMLAAHGFDALQRRSGPWRALFQRGAARAWAVALGTPAAILAIYYWLIDRGEERMFNALLVKFQAAGDVPFKWTVETWKMHLVPVLPEIMMLVGGCVLLGVMAARTGIGHPAAAVLLLLSLSHFWAYRTWLFAAPAAEVTKSLDWTAQTMPVLDDLELKEGQYRVVTGASGSWIPFLVDSPTGWRSKYVATAGADINMLNDIPSASGYSPLLMRDYARLAGNMHMSGHAQDPRFFSSPAMNLLNIRYVLVPNGDFTFAPEAFASLEQVSRSDLVTVYRNPAAPGMFWGVEKAVPGSSSDFWSHIEKSDFDFSRTALIEAADAGLAGRRFHTPETIQFSQKGGNRIEVKVSTREEAFLASSQLHYPGWFGWLDDRSVRTYRVNELFTGLLIPAGNHTVVLRFIPVSFWAGLVICALAVALLALTASRDLLGLRNRKLEP